MEKNNLLFLAVALIEAANAAGVYWRFVVTKKISGVQHYLAPNNLFTRDLSNAIFLSKDDAVWLAQGIRNAVAVQAPVYREK